MTKHRESQPEGTRGSESSPSSAPAATPANTHDRKNRLKDDVSRVRGWIRNLSISEPNAQILQGDLSVLAEAADLLKAFGDALVFDDMALPEPRYTETEMQHARKQSHADGYVTGRGAVLSALGLDPNRRDDDELNELLASPRVSAATPAPGPVKKLREWLLRLESDQARRFTTSDDEREFTEALRSVVSAAERPAPTWQPIETAPKDGTHILVCKWPLAGPNPEQHFGIFVHRAAWWAGEGEDGEWIVYNSMVRDPECHFTPTHWMSLPAPPGPVAPEKDK